MDVFLIYTLKVGICLAVFYLFFKLLLARETYHRLNRILILSAIVLSFLLPVCVITVERELLIPEAASSVLDAVAVVSETNESMVWLMILGYIYLLGIVVSLCYMCCSLLRVRRFFSKGDRMELEDGMHLILMSEKTAPFSWGKYIVMSREDWEIGGATILLHEQAHARLHHTWDILLTDMLGAAQWFNPAMRLLRRELRDLHEYEADAAVLRSGVEPKDYQLLLIKKAVGGRWYSVANSFNHNNLKKRINMMLQKKSSGMARAKSLIVLPLLCTAVLAFAETKYVPVGNKDSETSRNVVSSSGDVNVTISPVKVVTNKIEKDDTVSVSLTGQNVLFILDGKIVKSIDNIDADQIESMKGVSEKEAIEKYGIVAEGRWLVIEVTLKDDSDHLPLKIRAEEVKLQDNVETAPDYSDVLYVVDGKIVPSIDDIDINSIESMTVIKEKKKMKKYGEAAKGKDGVIEVKLKSEKK